MQNKKLCCPICRRDDDIYLLFNSLATIKVPVLDGKINPSYEILHTDLNATKMVVDCDPRQLDLGFDNYCDQLKEFQPIMLRFSSANNETYISIPFPEDEWAIRLHCPACKKASKVDISLLGGPTVCANV